MNPWLEDASSLADAIRHGDVRAEDALEATLAAIGSSRLNAVSYLDAEGARERSAEIDRDVAAGKDPGPFAGVPLLVKELEPVAGMPYTHASVAFKNQIAEYDSTPVTRLRNAGAVIVGL